MALLLVNVLIMVDRQIFTVLAEDIKGDLGLSDSQIGFAYGTAISVFYAVFSIPLGRYVDVGIRKNLLAACVTTWSAMIFMTGTARDFLSFSAFRIGVGIGEAGAAPAAISMIASSTSINKRATVMSIFAVGVPIGGGLGLFLGGTILDFWNVTFPDSSAAPLGLKGWQIAFFLVAIPGPFLAFWLLNLVEPRRDAGDDFSAGSTSTPSIEMLKEICSVVPIISLYPLWKQSGWRAVNINLGLAFLFIGLAVSLILLTGDIAQWCALFAGVWCITCWGQNLAGRDPVAFHLIIKCRALVLSNLGLAGFIFVVAGFIAWMVPYLMRAHEISAGEVGLMIGLLTAVFGSLGTLLGGVLSDWLESKTPRARIYVVIAALALSTPLIILTLFAGTLMEAYIWCAAFFMSSSAWYGIGPSIATSLVLPRMQGISTALYLVTISLFGVALGPYFTGRMSDFFQGSGAAVDNALRAGVLCSLGSVIVTFTLLVFAAIFIERDQATLYQRARDAGEGA